MRASPTNLAACRRRQKATQHSVFSSATLRGLHNNRMRSGFNRGRHHAMKCIERRMDDDVVCLRSRQCIASRASTPAHAFEIGKPLHIKPAVLYGPCVGFLWYVDFAVNACRAICNNVYRACFWYAMKMGFMQHSSSIKCAPVSRHA